MVEPAVAEPPPTRPRPSQERQDAISRFEEAFAFQNIEGAYAAMENACKAAYDEGVAGKPYVPFFVGKPKDVPEKPGSTGGYKVMEATGLWAAVAQGVTSDEGVKLPDPPYVVMKPGGNGITDAAALCFSMEDAQRVAKGLTLLDTLGKSV